MGHLGAGSHEFVMADVDHLGGVACFCEDGIDHDGVDAGAVGFGGLGFFDGDVGEVDGDDLVDVSVMGGVVVGEVVVTDDLVGTVAGDEHADFEVVFF